MRGSSFLPIEEWHCLSWQKGPSMAHTLPSASWGSLASRDWSSCLGSLRVGGAAWPTWAVMSLNSSRDWVRHSPEAGYQGFGGLFAWPDARDDTDARFDACQSLSLRLIPSHRSVFRSSVASGTSSGPMSSSIDIFIATLLLSLAHHRTIHIMKGYNEGI